MKTELLRNNIQGQISEHIFMPMEAIVVILQTFFAQGEGLPYETDGDARRLA